MSYMLDFSTLGYESLLNSGSGQQFQSGTIGNAPILNLLGQYAQNAGIQSPIPQQNQALQGVQRPGGPVTIGGVPQGQGATTAPNPANAGSFNAQRQQYNQAVQQQNQQNNAGPYALQPFQQQRLNQQLDMISKQQQVDIGQLQSDLAKRGITDPRALNAATEQLQQHYQGLAQRTSTDFYNQIKQEKQQEIANLLQAFTGLQEAGAAGLSQTGAIHEQTARQESAAFGNIINDLFGGAGAIAGAFTGVPGGGGAGGGIIPSVPSVDSGLGLSGGIGGGLLQNYAPLSPLSSDSLPTYEGF